MWALPLRSPPPLRLSAPTSLLQSWGRALASSGAERRRALPTPVQTAGVGDARLTEARLVLSPAADNLSRAQSGSSLSLASAATTEPESVHSGGTPSQR